VLATGTPEEILGDSELLIRANLIHEHLHGHGGAMHSHAHVHPVESEDFQPS
jgi:cobalt/nickel transport system ATP-binding protein